MRCSILVAASLALATLPAIAMPVPSGPADAVDRSASPATLVHHKPGHHGGPPWARGRERERDVYEDEAYEARPLYRRRICRTTYRTVYDRYTGDYVSRPVRVCRSDDF